MEKVLILTIVFFIVYCLPGLYGQDRTLPRGPWQLAFKVVSGKWDANVYGAASFWELLTSQNTYTSSDPVRDQRDFTSASDHFKSNLVEDWQKKLISVQAIKLSFFKDNSEQAYIVFNGVGKTKANWFQCNNILYSSYTDLGADNTLGAQCPGSSPPAGFPLTIMQKSHWGSQCSETTAWAVVVDANIAFSVCPDYAPTDDSIPKPYFRFSKMPTVTGDLANNLELADSIGIFFQVWDMVFKGIEALKPSDPSMYGLTDLYESDSTENDAAGTQVRNLLHDQSSKTFKSGVINKWDNFHIDTVKFSMLKSGQENAYVVFNGINTNSTGWFSQDNILYSSYGTSLDGADLAICSINGDLNRNWQIQSVDIQGLCGDGDQLGWMLVKEPRHNGTCEWDISKKKPYFLYNPNGASASPSVFHYADVMAVFVQGWRIAFKVSAGDATLPTTNAYDMWTLPGARREADAEAMSITAGSPSYKSDVIDQWDSVYIHAVKLAAYMDGEEVFYAVFDATGSSNMDWLDCGRLLYSSVPGLDRQTATSGGYTCSLDGTGVLRFLIGKEPGCQPLSVTGVFAVEDAGNMCSNKEHGPQFLFSNTLDGTLSESNEDQFADTLAVFVQMDNCYDGLCKNAATCQDIAGNFRCFCDGDYYGPTCANLDGTWTVWSAWSPCSVTCGDGLLTKTRQCQDAEGAGTCPGDNVQNEECSFDPCKIDGGYTEWTEWWDCSQTCNNGSQSRSRTCTNPAPQNGGADCGGEAEVSRACNTDPCPVDGGFTEWTDWSTCTLTCGTGTQSKSRDCTNPAPAHGGADCEGDPVEFQACSTDPCPIDGGFTDWSEWSQCSLTCGNGSQSRSRDCTDPAPQHGGIECAGEGGQTRPCNTDPCPINGGYTHWTVWGECTQTCGTGTQTRSRDCTNPAPRHGGENCIGEPIAQQDCNKLPCPIDGGFTEWTEWGMCTKTCGVGNRSRSRDCANPAPQYGGDNCDGGNRDLEQCSIYPCPVDGGFTAWTRWDACTRTCGKGSKSRSRDCTNPTPQYGGKGCIGEEIDIHSCNTEPCPIDGGFTEWSEWGMCTKTCGVGNRSRSRDCASPAPQYGGDDCDARNIDFETCNIHPCPVDGGYTLWTRWDTCTRTCGTGSQSRSRDCTNPTPKYGGRDCVDDTIDIQSCKTDPCPIDGGFTSWTEWEHCVRTCGTGIKSRSRDCTNPAPNYGGRDCDGDRLDYTICNENPCPIDGSFTDWTEWSTCTQTCGIGNQTRSRDCANPAPQHGGADCVGESLQQRVCNTDPCPVDGGYTEWTTWTECSLTCGSGNQSRFRECTNPVPRHGGSDCSGTAAHSQHCNIDPCPIDGGFSDWTEWSTCTQICGWGIHLRSRGCTNPAPQYGGAGCDGENFMAQACTVGPCPIDGEWSEWTQWSPCSVTCGTGDRTRSRECNSPTPDHGGRNCTGNATQSVACNDIPCPVDGQWSDWSDWTTCTVTCGGGTHERTRACDGPMYGGAQCDGDMYGVEACGTEDCPPVDGVWSDWSGWTECSKTCGDGLKVRVRNCSKPQHGGQPCDGFSLQSVICKKDKCPVDGTWSVWTEWSVCTETCGGGIQGKTRTCTPPEYGGLPCQGHPSEVSICNAEDCPAVDGGWTDWSQWSTCTKTCGVGDQSRSRTCTNPKPEWGGQSCDENHAVFRYCNQQECPVDGGWGEWSVWTACQNMTNSKCTADCPCGHGRKSRVRVCDDPIPKHEGKNCTGEDLGYRSCNNPCADFQCDPNNPENCKVKNENGGDMKHPTGILLAAMVILSVLFI